MDQQKIGRFIAERRRACDLTQMQLAEKLNITDRAVSKWERGHSMPDASIMLELCHLLNISVTDLLCGEVVTVNEQEKKLQEQTLELVNQKVAADRRLLSLEIVIGVLAGLILFAMVFVASFVPMADWLRILLIVLGFIPFIIGIGFALKVEQVAGYYECAKCRHRYVPTYSSVLWAMHVNRTRYMKCPHCHKRSWQKKVLTKE
ncbi:MAG: helix-turn-helix transcriptional regulator [Clostridia bacterium]|nr:helix-turn-helix transcriptional regulator [Clostridia bacterium]